MDLNYPPALMISVQVKTKARIRNPDVRFYIILYIRKIGIPFEFVPF